jgi:hypothetical protein
MNVRHLVFTAILFLTIPGSAQDWQHCKPEGSYSFVEVKDAVHRVTTTHAISGWDTKTFNRSGDLVPLAIAQSLSDTDMRTPETLEEVLFILREAYACPSRCVTSPEDRQPRIALLLLEHLHNNTSGKMQSRIDETKEFIMRQERPAE